MAVRVNFTNELGNLVNDVRVVGAQLEETFDKVIQNLDDKNAVLAKVIRKADKKFNEREHNIMQKCLTLVLTQAPVATDWRKIASIMELVIDIERIADHCSDISKYTAYLSEFEPASESVVERRSEYCADARSLGFDGHTGVGEVVCEEG